MSRLFHRIPFLKAPIAIARALPDAAFSDETDPEAVVEVAATTMYHYYRYGDGGWSHHRMAAEAYFQEGSAEAVTRALGAYYSAFQPATLAEALCVADSDLLAQLSAYQRFQPWRRVTKLIAGHDGAGHQSFGPVTPVRLQREVDRIVSICESFRRNGYQPERYRSGFVIGYALTDGDRCAFLVTKGQHRVAALAAMGVTRFTAKFDPRVPRIIDRATLPLWPHVRSGYCSTELAAGLFDRHLAPFDDPRKQLGSSFRPR